MQLIHQTETTRTVLSNKNNKFTIKQNNKIIFDIQACEVYDLLRKTMSTKSRSPGVSRRAKEMQVGEFLVKAWRVM